MLDERDAKIIELEAKITGLMRGVRHELALEIDVRRYVINCSRDRLAAAYEFASMLDGYDPEWWRALMRARNCGEMSGKPL